ncbi:unnamed protein product, partial [Colletotrichum noveboracense]
VSKGAEYLFDGAWRGPSRHADEHGQPGVDAEELQAKELSICLMVLGEDHPDTLTSMNNLASTFWIQGRWKEAEELQAKELSICSTVLGEDHPDTLTSMHNLAFTWKDLEYWEDAMQLLQDCVRRRENVLGVDHPETKSSASALSDWELDFGETSREVSDALRH